MPDSVPPAEPPTPPPSDERAPLRTFEYGFDRRRQSGPFALVLAAFVGALLAGGAVAVAFLTLGRGGSEVDADRQTAASIAAILALSGDSQSRFEEFIAATPDSLPERIPAHPGARLVVSYRLGLSDGADTYLLVSRVDEAEDAVVAFFLDALDRDPWQVTGGSSSPDLVAVQFSNVEDPDIQGAVNIRSPREGATTILTVVQAPHQDTGEPPIEGSRTLPPGFPAEVPVYPEAVVTDAAFLKQPGSTRFFLSALTPDEITAVIEFYKNAFEEQGWNVEALAGGEDTVSFVDPDERFGGAVTVSGDDAHDGYTRIDLVVDRSTRGGN